MTNVIRQYIQAVLHSYSDVYFMRNTYIGLMILIVSLLNYNVFLMGLLALLSAILFGVFIGVNKEALKSGFLTYNALLVGSSIGYIFHISPLVVFFVVSAGIFTLFISIMLNSIFSYYLALPIFSLPFVFVSSMTYMASFSYSNLFVSEYYHPKMLNLLELPYWLAGFLKSLGAVLFLPFPIVGLLFSLLLLYHSRILFFLAVSGYYLGATVSGMMEGSVYQAHADLNNYNYILIAMAIGGIFLVPSPRSYVVAAAAVIISTILVDAGAFLWSGYGILTFSPMPFNIVALCFLYVLNLSSFKFVTTQIRNTPEATLDNFLSNAERFNITDVKIGLPFSGKWTVWQGFDGKWTHKGNWRYAYDFVITKGENTYKGAGDKLIDYYCFNKPVFAPIRGRVVKVVNTLEDNPIGAVDRENNWGNVVIIESPLGHFVELSHFAQNSISVEQGQWVEAGTLIGKCGNSGFSPEPHIHIQVQKTKDVGAPTTRFLFSGYISEGIFYAEGLPDEKAIITSIRPEKSLHSQLGFILDSTETYSLSKGSKKLDDISITIKSNSVGEMYFSTENGNLFFNKDYFSFYFYRIEGNDPLLSSLFMACSRIPLSYKRGLVWNDITPLGLAVNGLQYWVFGLLRSFNHNIGKLRYSASWKEQNIFSGNISGKILTENIQFEVVLSKKHSIREIRINDMHIRKKEYENSSNNKVSTL